ncbi:unnamed protein product, partial [marine sediment metagenome]
TWIYCAYGKEPFTEPEYQWPTQKDLAPTPEYP